MPLSDTPIGIPDLEKAIDRNPLTVSPDTPVVDAIALMSQSRGQSCSLPNLHNLTEIGSSSEARSSCVLAIQDAKVIGIFTERDIVRLAVTGKPIENLRVAEVMAHPVVTLSQTNFQDIFAALFLFRRYRIRHLPIINEADRLVGVVSPESIRQVLQPANLLKMRRVADVMSKQVIRSPLHASVLSVAQLMAEHRVSCVAIAQEDEDERLRPVGIITERDIVQFQFLQLDLETIPVQDVMSTPLFLLSPEDSLWTAHQEMQKRRVRRLVVSWNWGQGLGIVTQTSLLRAFDPMEMYWTLESLQQTVQQFQEKYGEDIVERNFEGLRSDREISILPSGNCAATPPQTPELLPLLHSLRAGLETLLETPELPLELRQVKLKRAIADLSQLERLLL